MFSFFFFNRSRRFSLVHSFFSSGFHSIQSISRRLFWTNEFFRRTTFCFERDFQKQIIIALKESIIVIKVLHCKANSMLPIVKCALWIISNNCSGSLSIPISTQISGRIMPSFRFPRNGTPIAFRTSRFNCILDRPAKGIAMR